MSRTNRIRVARIVRHGIRFWSDAHRWEVLHYWHTKRFTDITE